MPLPFRIDVPQAKLDAILARVRDYSWDALPDAGGWAHGTSIPFMRDLCRHWLDRYDWRAAEADLNRLPQFKADADGLALHFVHVKGVGPSPKPLVITHGWPGSFFEFAGVVGPLADPARFGGDPADAFDVVVPSMPGYGFSDRPSAPIGPRSVARHIDALMKDVLGYHRYIAQGGDWGGAISGWLGHDHPACGAVHLNMVTGTSQSMKPETEAEKAWAAQLSKVLDEEGGYRMLQATRPQTLAFAMHDSPVGVAAWIVEKFAAWSDLPRGADGAPDLLARYSMDALLTNIMIYLVTDSFATAAWLYRGRQIEQPLRFPGRVSKPTGVAAFPDPCFKPPPRSFVEKGFDVIHWTDMARGGHFAALEEPELFVGDVRAFGRKLEW